MTKENGAQGGVESLLDTPELAEALHDDRFRQFLDHIPFGIAVADLRPAEAIAYVNPEFERLTGLAAADAVGKSWDAIDGTGAGEATHRSLAAAIIEGSDHIGQFTLAGEGAIADVWSSVIAEETGEPAYRLVALAETKTSEDADGADLRALLIEKDTLLRELQHRVKNNLQMITALIRLEARSLPVGGDGAALERVAGRIHSLAVLYTSLEQTGAEGSVDLGTYISEIASNVMKAHSTEGIRLALSVDSWTCSVDVAMPAGLLVNELMTNALKHAFTGREGGTITVDCLVEDAGCTVCVEDDGNGMADSATWPRPGKLSAMIVHSLRQNAGAAIEVDSAPGRGMRVAMRFARARAEAGA